jgi:hypothetical protein
MKTKAVATAITSNAMRTPVGIPYEFTSNVGMKLSMEPSSSSCFPPNSPNC